MDHSSAEVVSSWDSKKKKKKKKPPPPQLSLLTPNIYGTTEIFTYLQDYKTIIKLFVSVKHNNILLFILTYWRQVSVVRLSSGHPYKKFLKSVTYSAY